MAETDDYFSTPEAASRLDLIRHLIENSELVPLVRGPSGSGKTLLASRLQALAPENWMVCHFSADSMMQPERLLAHIARCSGLSDAPGNVLNRLVERFEVLRSRGQVPVLLVDDVQSLPPTSLITLLRLYERQVGGAPLVSLVLFANEQIDMLLSTPQLQIMSPQAIQAIDLPPLTREEASRFMDFLLRSEGLPDSLRLDESKLTRIFRETQGIPGVLAAAILNAVGEEHESPAAPNRRLSPPVLFGGISTLVVLGLLLIFQGPINRLFQPEAPAPVAKTPPVDGKQTRESQQRQPVANKPDAPPGEAPMRVERPSVAAQKSVQPPVLPSEPTVAQVPQAKLAEASTPASPPQSEPAVVKGGETVPVPSVLPAGSGVKEQPPAAVSAGETQPQQKKAQAVTSSVPPQVVAGTAETKPQKLALEAPETVEKAAPAAAEKPVAEAPKTAVPAKVAQMSPPTAEPVKTEQKAETKPVDGHMRSREWLLSQAPDQYTIQLLAVENIESIQAYIKHHALAEDAFSLQITRNGKTWYPLLWRVFPNKSAATEAIKQLPEEIRKSGAWVRSFASLQK